MKNIYYSPKDYGLEVVATIEREPEYDFDMIVVWQDNHGNLFWDSYAGCSCLLPFQDYTCVEDLNILYYTSIEEMDMFYDIKVNNNNIHYSEKFLNYIFEFCGKNTYSGTYPNKIEGIRFIMEVLEKTDGGMELNKDLLTKMLSVKDHGVRREVMRLLKNV